MGQLGFSWFVAWRHLRDPERRSSRGIALLLGIILVILGIGTFISVKYFGQKLLPNQGFLAARPNPVLGYVQIAGGVTAGVGALLALFGTLTRLFTLFTAISIFGVFLGTAAPIIVLSVMSGFEMDLKGKIRGAKADVVITKADVNPFLDWREIRERILAIPGVRAATPYLEAEVMIRSGTSPAGIMVRGIDPETAASVLDLDKSVKDCTLDDIAHPERLPKDPYGELPDADAPVILLGHELYTHTLRVFKGSYVDVVCPMCKIGPTGPMPGLKRFRVGGHFYSGMYEFDSKLAYMSLAEAQRFLYMPGEVTGIDVRVTDPSAASQVAASIQKTMGAAYDVRSWEELNKALFMALKIEKIGMFVVMTFIALVASFSIISTLIMNATDKAREIAILKAMGATEKGIRRIFMAQGLYIGLVGLLLGGVVGIEACLFIKEHGLPLPSDIYYINQLPVVLRTSEVVTVAVLALLLCYLATVYPARLAARMRPVDGLRYE